MYSFPASDRVSIALDRGGAAVGAIYYRITRHPLFGAVIEAKAASVSWPHLASLSRRHSARVVTISPGFPEDFRRVVEAGGRASRCEEDFVMDLPATGREYLDSLGRQTRKHLPYYLRRLQRTMPSVEFVVRAGPEITREEFSELVALSAGRLESKGIRTLWTPELVQQRWELARQSGRLCTFRDGARIIAGALVCVHQGEAYLVLIGHDVRHDDLDLGITCLWQTIEAMIAEGAKRFHFLWGRSAYKTQLGGVERPLQAVRVFRSGRTRALWTLGHAAGMTFRFARRAVRRILRSLRRRGPPKT
jgi:CelD/BcsL family acetyltransferase involved in cellulose biosynthesis